MQGAGPEGRGSKPSSTSTKKQTTKGLGGRGGGRGGKDSVQVQVKNKATSGALVNRAAANNTNTSEMEYSEDYEEDEEEDDNTVDGEKEDDDEADDDIEDEEGNKFIGIN